MQHRAIEAMIRGMPAVNRDLMYQAMLRETKALDNQTLFDKTWVLPDVERVK